MNGDFTWSPRKSLQSSAIWTSTFATNSGISTMGCAQGQPALR